MSVKPVKLGINIIQDQPPSKPNIFYQMMRGIREVETKYIAVVEDDCVYPPEHFTKFRPKDNELIYNQHRWSLYTWNPIYSLKNYIRTNATLIAPTKLALEMLEARFKKFPLGGEMPLGMCGELGTYEKSLGLPQYKIVDVKSDIAVVQLDTDFFTVHNPAKESVERRHQKKPGVIQAYSIPHWNEATNLTQYFE